MLWNIHLIRKEYWYTDEYILDRTLGWIEWAISMIQRDRYTEQYSLTNMILRWYVSLHDKKGKTKLESYDELIGRLEYEEKHSNEEASDEDLSNIWLWF